MEDLPIIKILLATIGATSMMTLFSYIISGSFKELYKEPLLLKYLLKRTSIELSDNGKEILAWLIHYFIGLIFVVCYHFIWKLDLLEITLINGLLLGAICGIIGILGWMIMFKASGYKPNIDYKGYYFQLFFAHVIFGITATAIYKYF